MNQEELLKRLQTYALSAFKFCKYNTQDDAVKHLFRQLTRSASSPALNFAEADGSASPRDFLNRLRICLKELNESKSNLTIISQILPGHKRSEVDLLHKETNELIWIFLASSNTMKKKQEKEK